MINDHTLRRFGPFGKELVRPIYDGYSFALLPATLHFLLTGERIGPLLAADCFGGDYPKPRRIILFFVDSFGWRFWERYWDRSVLLRRVVEHGVLTPVSALFPSTTAASVTTLNLGVLPAQHAVYEWNLYVPTYGETIQSLAFATLGRDSISCLRKGYDVGEMIVGRETAHHRLARHGVRSIQLGHRNYIGGPYNRVVSAGADVRGHRSWPEALTHLRDALDETSSTGDAALINLYWGGLDHAAHVHGPGSAVHDAEVIAFLAAMDVLLADVRVKDALVIFTADHGHVRAIDDKTHYVNECWPEISGCLARSATGGTIWPNGSPRDMFLHVAPEFRDLVVETLRNGLEGQAEVLPMDDAVGEGLFGPQSISDELRRRLGDVLVLPCPGHFVWWREPGLVENPFLGHHGGLSIDEMATVVGVMDGL